MCYQRTINIIMPSSLEYSIVLAYCSKYILSVFILIWGCPALASIKLPRKNYFRCTSIHLRLYQQYFNTKYPLFSCLIKNHCMDNGLVLPCNKSLTEQILIMITAVLAYFSGPSMTGIKCKHLVVLPMPKCCYVWYYEHLFDIFQWISIRITGSNTHISLRW